jgi:plastocyanin
MNKRIGSAFIIAIAAALVGMSCSDDNNDNNQQQAFVDGGLGGAGGSGGAGGTGGSGGGSGVDAAVAYVITISNFTFSPDNLDVPAGGTVTVRNNDTVPHSATSETVEASFVPGAAGGVSFDTGVFASGERTFTIPATAAPGTVVPYFCTVHTSAMKNNPHITVR